MIKFGVDALETGFHLCLCLFSLCFFVLTVGNTALQSCGSFSLYHYRWKLGQKHMTLTVPKNIPWTLYPLSCWLLSICRYYLFYISSAVHIWCSPNTSFPSPRNVIVPFVLYIKLCWKTDLIWSIIFCCEQIVNEKQRYWLT